MSATEAQQDLLLSHSPLIHAGLALSFQGKFRKCEVFLVATMTGNGDSIDSV